MFKRYDGFMGRLSTISEFFNTAQQFQKLEKVEIGGIRGKLFTSHVKKIFEEFKELYGVFGNRTYDALNPNDKLFLKDYEKFNGKIFSLDRKLGAILGRAFDDCTESQSTFKLLHVFGSLTERKLISSLLSEKMPQLVSNLTEEMAEAKTIFLNQENKIKLTGRARTDRNMPPVSGQLRFAKELRDKISVAIKDFKGLSHPVCYSEAAKEVIERYKEMVCLITSYEERVFENWSKNVENLATENLEQPLLVRDQEDGTLKVNFGNDLMSTLMEVKNLKREFQTRRVPSKVAEVFIRFEEYRNNKNSLDHTVNMYNYVKINTVKEENNLIEREIELCDEKLRPAETRVNWNTRNTKDYLEELRCLTSNLETRVVMAQGNVKKIKREISRWADLPLYTRTEEPNVEPLLDLATRDEVRRQRYAEIEEASATIQTLIQDNEELLKGSDQDLKNWNLYLRYIDEMVTQGLLKMIAVSLGYLLDQTDQKKCPSPLFSAEMELCEPHIIFRPSLDRKIHNNFYDIFLGIIDDIFNMAKLVPRVHKRKGAASNYLDTVTNHQELRGLKEELIKRVEAVMEKANDRKNTYLDFSYLWQESRKEYLHYFLTYARQLTQEELEKLEENETAIKKVTPKLAQFQEQIDQYEAVHEEVRKVENVIVFQFWFRTDATSFKNTLLNCVKKWSFVFKKHLLDHVVNSLSELNKFVDKAEEALMTQVHEGDYNGLIKVMEYLALVAGRQKATDAMFDPLQDVIDLLRQYGMAIPNESLAQFDDLPEKWANTKRLSVTAKQQVAPLMGMEVGKLKDRIEEYDKCQKNYRLQYQESRFFDYQCKAPYEGLSKAQVKINEFMTNINTLQSEAALFEVTVPAFSHIVQCKKENRLLKELWDYIFLVRTSIESWKITKWADIDVESMEMECKKYSKDIRGLDKDMRNWNSYLGLESAVKNMLTSLRAIGELQNNAIRDRHWEQLVQVVRVRFVMSEDTTLAHLLKLNLHNFEVKNFFINTNLTIKSLFFLLLKSN